MAHRNSNSQAQSFTKPSSVKTALNGSFEIQEKHTASPIQILTITMEALSDCAKNSSIQHK
jgi:hypothetical protein